MNPIGGYFELELRNHGTLFHDDAVALNSGRSALEYILRTSEKCKTVYVPYYSCDSILQPIERLKFNIKFYELDSALSPRAVGLGKNECLLYINYFGLNNLKVREVARKYGDVIVDNSQAFFAKPLKDVPTLYSPRKFFGVPDGGFAYTRKKRFRLKRDKSIGRFGHLLKRLEDGPEAGYEQFVRDDAAVSEVPMSAMSTLTQRLLENVDFEEARERRNINFRTLHRRLRRLNEFTKLIENDAVNGPMVYPYLRKDNHKIRRRLLAARIYVATYWPSVFHQTRPDSFERYLADNLLPLPIDQRYSIDEMETILGTLE